jgi:hypothetical protein
MHAPGQLQQVPAPPPALHTAAINRQTGIRREVDQRIYVHKAPVNEAVG